MQDPDATSDLKLFYILMVGAIHDNPADMMTKTLSVAKFEHCSGLIGDRCCWVFVEEVVAVIENWSSFYSCIRIRLRVEVGDLNPTF